MNIFSAKSGAAISEMNVHGKLMRTRALKNIRLSGGAVTSSCRHFHGPTKPEEYVQVPQFPKVEQFRTADEREYDALKNTMKSLKTVEEKQIYLNKPKYYGWFSTVLDPDKILPDSLDFFQYATNTTLVDEMPQKLKDLQELAATEAEKLEPFVKKHLLRQSQTESKVEVPRDKVMLNEFTPSNEETFAFQENKINKSLTSLHRLLHIHLAQRHPHLIGHSIDTDSRVEAFWMRGGFQPDDRMVSKRKGLKEFRERTNFPERMQISEEKVWRLYDSCIQIKGNLFPRQILEHR